MMIGGGRAIRLYESALADVRYVYGHRVAFPLRKSFATEADHKAALKRHWHAREAVEADELRRTQRKGAGDE